MPSEDPYIVITCDTHAGASVDGYRDYLDPSFRQAFDDWRGSYRNPAKKHIGGKKIKNWDSQVRSEDLSGDGVVGEVIFPNTVPPFYEKAFHISAPATPAQYERFRAGTQAHNRWLAEFCAEEPLSRAGIGLIHLNDLDDAIEDVKWIAENGLRGGMLLPLPSPSDTHLPALNDPRLDRLWAVIQDHDLVMNQHAGQGSPGYSGGQGSKALWALEMSFYVQRGFSTLIMGGVFERFPDLKFILTESGCSWAPQVMKNLDSMYLAWKMGAIGEIDTSNDPPLKELPSFYAKRNCWYGASFPGPADIQGREVVGIDRILWGNDYPHYEGCYPYSRENMRFAFSDVSEKDVRMMLSENAAALYGFDLDALRAAAGEIAITPELVRVPLDEIPEDSTCITFQRARAQKAMGKAL
ncbi:MAG: amidohydrolase [bacterium]|nr:amidohydrolase [Deltaproteobacteria bacterium]MCP4906538.1 amidohydrolase [bacterium]